MSRSSSAPAHTAVRAHNVTDVDSALALGHRVGFVFKNRFPYRLFSELQLLEKEEVICVGEKGVIELILTYRDWHHATPDKRTFVFTRGPHLSHERLWRVLAFHMFDEIIDYG